MCGDSAVCCFRGTYVIALRGHFCWRRASVFHVCFQQMPRIPFRSGRIVKLFSTTMFVFLKLTIKNQNLFSSLLWILTTPWKCLFVYLFVYSKHELIPMTIDLRLHPYVFLLSSSHETVFGLDQCFLFPPKVGGVGGVRGGAHTYRPRSHHTCHSK